MMKILNNNKKLEIHSSILDNINDSNYKITLASKKNCCKEETVKILSTADLEGQGISKIFLNGDIYFPGKDAGINSITFKNSNNITYTFPLAANQFYLKDNATEIISAYNTWKLLDNNFKDTKIQVYSVSNNSVIEISNLKFGFEILDTSFYYTGNTNFKGEITNNETFYPFDFIGDGIYSFTLKSENLTTGSTITETGCIAVLDDIKCLIPNVLIKNKNSLAHLLYQSIIDVQDCNCMCEDMCEIYNSLYEEVRWN